jgi:sn-glycerol 3-phosphate transport system ATP-binding protein
MSEIKLENLKKSFGKTEVIHDLSINVKDGELIVIVGPSGCGKSTLLRMVAGLEDANEGNIIIDGKKINELEPMERNIAMVFQNYALYPHMSVFGNMKLTLEFKKLQIF